MAIPTLVPYVGLLLLLIIYILGLVVSVRAFLRCRKRGYLLIGAWFAFAVFQMTVLPVIMHQRERLTTPVERAEDKNELVDVASENEVRNTMLYYLVMSVVNGLSLLLLVSGLWLIARREDPLAKTQGMEGERPREP